MAGPDPEQLAARVLDGDRGALARAITLVESTHPDHEVRAGAMLDRLLPRTGEAARVGISGVPGAGKSTFIDVLGRRLVERGRRVAVLAVDPSSRISGGSILGDRTRMGELARSPQAFIRPSPAGYTLGGVAARTRESMLCCEAAGFDVVLVETVGVGQSETAVAEMVDVTLALFLAGAGDELQGIKRGILEVVDLLVVHKADGDNRAPAEAARGRYRSALRLLRGRDVPVQTCSSTEDEGVAEVWDTLETRREERRASGALTRRRAEQAVAWTWRLVDERLRARVRAPAHEDAVDALLADVRAGRRSASAAAAEILRLL